MQRFDSDYGVVVGGNKHGIYIRTNSGENVFSYYGSLPNGTCVFVSIAREGRDDKLPLAKVDAVVNLVA